MLTLVQRHEISITPYSTQTSMSHLQPSSIQERSDAGYSALRETFLAGNIPPIPFAVTLGCNCTRQAQKPGVTTTSGFFYWLGGVGGGRNSQSDDGSEPRRYSVG